MQENKYKKLVQKILLSADVKINGHRPWDITVNDEKFYQRLLSDGSLGLGESYMEGWWDCKNVDQLFFKVLRADLKKHVDINFVTIKTFLQSKLFNLQTISRSRQVAYKHYDLSNTLYSKMLGSTMSYTCGYWQSAKTLDDAQEAKLELICKKIGLKSGMTVLDIGCGFGNFMKYAAEKYGAKVTGISLSKEQIKLGKELCTGLDVEFKLIDYRKFHGSFDRVVSIEMFEAVGYKNFRVFMEKVSECLKDDGLFLLQTIGNRHTWLIPEPWLDKYIFPNGFLPSLQQISKAVENIFIVENLENFGSYYDLTLMAWFKNFETAWPVLKKDFDETFYRMWKYYLLSCAGMFRSREVQLWQFVFSKKGVLGGYESDR